jgi:hypothetical protein
MDDFDELKKKLYASDEFKKMKDQIAECVNFIQIHMSKSMKPEESHKILIDKGFSNDVIQLAMMLIEKMYNDSGNPLSPVMNSITKHMTQINDDISKIKDVKGFYDLISKTYMDKFMQDEEIRGMPITFLFNGDGNKDNKIGIVPMNSTDHSPMDDLKKVVYSANPEAYLFCGEASMLKMSKEEWEKEEMKDYKYGHIQKNENSVDVVILQGNDRCNQNQLTKVYDLKVLKSGKIKFKERKFDQDNMESEKLP